MKKIIFRFLDDATTEEIKKYVEKYNKSKVVFIGTNPELIQIDDETGEFKKI